MNTLSYGLKIGDLLHLFNDLTWLNNNGIWLDTKLDLYNLNLKHSFYHKDLTSIGPVNLNLITSQLIYNIPSELPIQIYCSSFGHLLNIVNNNGKHHERQLNYFYPYLWYTNDKISLYLQFKSSYNTKSSLMKDVLNINDDSPFDMDNPTIYNNIIGSYLKTIFK